MPFQIGLQHTMDSFPFIALMSRAVLYFAVFVNFANSAKLASHVPPSIRTLQYFHSNMALRVEMNT